MSEQAIFHYIQHSCFTVTKNGVTLLFDPFIDGNPEGLGVNDIKADYIFVSHAHGDHLGSALEIAKACDATIISTNEIGVMASGEGCKAEGMHIGGTHQFPFGKVRITLAFHGSGIAGGHACGFVVDLFGTKFYFAGDTGIFMDMQLLQRLDAFDYAILPIGDYYTMGPADAAIAAELLKAKYVIPVHYNTWPPIAQDPEAFKAKVEATTPSKVLIVKPGSSIELE